MPIKVLAPQVVARIAAGEVVERPASVVKEMVENSLDAGATQIAVEAGGGGVGLIRVTDNGTGIPAGELELAFQRYATSKVTKIDDLESITTLGFRGEALPSIAAVAEVDIVTCASGESVGTHLILKEGIATNRDHQARSPGTTITVRQLFRNVPARLKFLKSPATENSHIAQVVSQYAFAYTEVKFTLAIDGRTLLRTPGNDRLIDSVIAVYGPEIARNMLEIGRDTEWEGSTSSVIVTGMVGSPAVSRASRDYLSFFVNRRWINSRWLAWAVEEAYHGLLMTGKHPVAVINIALPTREIDVNIHPTKTEVKFQNERAVVTAVRRAVRRTLMEQAPVPQIEEATPLYTAPARPRPAQPMEGLTWPSTSERPASSRSLTQPTPAFSLPALRLLGQLSASYIVAEGPDGLYLIDQHAAHERVLFEQIKHQLAQQKIGVQGLLEPATLEVSPRQDATLKLHHNDLAEFGFSLEPFGERTYVVRSMPVWLDKKDWLGMLRELMDSPTGGDWRETIAISIACHSAVRAGQILTDDEMRNLIRELEKTALPNTCPHGRPTMTHLSSGQLEKEFRRV
jgi:DNA mismatch repair protein MutL